MTATTADESTLHRPLRVLLADDQAMVRAGFRLIIDSQPDLTVVGEVDNGRAAVEMAQRMRPDVCILDIRMPVLDGLAATRLLAGPDVERPSPHSLSQRELEIARAVATGLSNQEIAATLFISLSTVKTHLTSIQLKLHLRNRVEIAIWVLEGGHSAR